MSASARALGTELGGGVGVGAEVVAEGKQAGPVPVVAEHQMNMAGAGAVLAVDQDDTFGPELAVAALDVFVAVGDQNDGVPFRDFDRRNCQQHIDHGLGGEAGHRGAAVVFDLE